MRIRGILDSLLLASMWGPSFIFIKLAVEEVPPLTFVALRLAIASLLLFTILKIRGEKLPPLGKVWFHFFAMGAIACSIPFFLFSYSEQYISSALAGIINGTTPIFATVLAHRFLVGEHITPAKAIGVTLGLVGFIFVLLPTLLDGTIEGDTIGILGVATASLCYAIGMVYGKTYLNGYPALVAPTTHLITTTTYLIPLALIIDAPYNLPLPSTQALSSVLAISIWGTAGATFMFYNILMRHGASVLAAVTFLLPLFGAALGYLFLSETLTWNVFVGAAFILTAMLVINGVITLPIRKKVPVK
ncbi:Uncharacterized protein SCG7109_AI_00100 [Chlamydiales bacterium SCGC AG-110-M15]|nr:Uncharacterized protein SCG7109_AI_00100 [Chlamydiales bacterium SCGC AG-110-M15]